MRVDIWSDVICPWCYLGHRRFQRALAELPWGAEVEVRFRAYQLDPRAPREPGDLREAIERKYGSGSFDGMNARLSRLGATEGIDYRFDLAQRVNTLDAHRLLAWAGTLGSPQQHALVERMFLAYFTEGENVADHATLVRLAGEVSLDSTAAAAVLASSDHFDDVVTDIEAAVEHQITGVPAFVIEGAWVIPGAQDVDVLAQLLTRARERLAA